jgi:hypothetical protein
MNLVFAVERLLETGWCPTGDSLERLPDGRAYPSVIAVQREFTRAGLELSIKQNLVFGCYHGTWAPVGEAASEEKADALHGTVVGSCEREAAVYALAQLREAQQGQQLQLQVSTGSSSNSWEMQASMA